MLWCNSQLEKSNDELLENSIASSFYFLAHFVLPPHPIHTRSDPHPQPSSNPTRPSMPHPTHPDSTLPQLRQIMTYPTHPTHPLSHTLPQPVPNSFSESLYVTNISNMFYRF